MSKIDEWWRTFFSGGMVEFWLRATTDEQTRQEADFIAQTLHVSAPAKLLDVPCGGGRHSLELARRGYHMTGVDLSTEFLAAARAKTTDPSTKVTWEQRDMRDLPWRDQFDGAFSFGNSFGYLDDADNADFIQAVARALKPGARFVLDACYLSEGVLLNFQERAWYPVGDGVVLADRRYDHVTSRLHVEYTWIQGGKSEKRAMSARLHSYREIAELFEEAGFTNLEAFSSLAREPFKFGSKQLLMVGTKKGS